MSKSIKAPLQLLTANLFFTGSFSLVKLISTTLSVDVIMLVRFLAGPVFLIPFFLMKRKKIHITSYPMFFLRICFGISAMSCLFLSFKYGQIGKSMLIFECSAIWTLCFGYIAHKNKPHKASLLAIPLAFIGLFLILKPEQITEFNIGNAFALLGSFLNAGVYITVKKLRDNHDTATIVLVTYTISALIMLVPTLISAPIISSTNLMLLTLMGSIGLIGQLFMTLGFKYSSAGICSLLMLMLVPLTTLSGLFFFNETHTLSTWIGIGLIFFTLVIISKYQ